MERTAEPHQLDAQPTTCICPICREFHELKLHWIGNGIPRKFCLKCRQNQPRLFRCNDEPEYRYGGQRERTSPISELPLIPQMVRRFGTAGG
jgi:Zn ribbon nucleic-acid-binding protein